MNAGFVFPRISIDRIKAAVAAEFDIPRYLLVTDRRNANFARARQVAMDLAWRLTPCSSPAIGRVFGNRDHTTVLYAHSRITELRQDDRQLDAAIHRIEAVLRPLELREELQLSMFIGPLFDGAHRRAETLPC